MKFAFTLCIARLTCPLALSLALLGQSTVTTTGGTANRVAKYSGSASIVNSLLFDNGSSLGLGTTAPTATFHIANAGAASKPALLLNGAWFTGGTATTNLPQVLIQPAGTVSTNWSGLGTGLGINARSGFTGYLILGQVNGVNQFRVSYSGAVSANFLGNVVSFSNAQITLGSTGPVISRNIADANAALIVQQRSASSTGDILQLKNSASTLMAVKLSGNVGIGTTAPGSRLTVAGKIQSTTGGFTFPDGTVQTTAAVGGGGGGLTSVSHNTTLVGSGTSASPLGVAVPLITTGTSIYAIAAYGAPGWEGLFSTGGSAADLGGSGLVAQGGDSSGSDGGYGVDAVGGMGGPGISSVGGHGIFVQGGNASPGGGGFGGFGISAYGGFNSDGTTRSWAGVFQGDVFVQGNLSKSGGSFKIDHPLDPANKYLSHSFVESPDMMNVYNGNIFTDGHGMAIVTLPDWFETLNRDFRYQLTVIGQFAQAIIASKISSNQFTIRTDKANVEVSWQVTGIRQDAWANAHRIPVEQDKPAREQGHYLHPELYNEAPELSVEWATHPDVMRKLRGQRNSGRH